MATNKELYLTPDEAGMQFQFLIGWLQTLVCANKKQFPYVVSIPYRLATNPETKDPSSGLVPEVSIPYRLATNYTQKSQVHIESIVSIPYRLATNTRLQRAGKIRGGMFQFLIGWLQTRLEGLSTSMILSFNSL